MPTISLFVISIRAVNDVKLNKLWAIKGKKKKNQHSLEILILLLP